MDWLRTHPYAAALSVAGILVVLGAYVVQRQTAAPARPATSAWGGMDTSLLNPTSYPIRENISDRAGTPRDQENIMENVKSGPPYTYTPPSSLATPPSTEGEDSFDFDAFVAMLSQNSAAAQKTPAGTKTSAPTYSFIPNGLMSTSTPHDSRTQIQQTLYDYGNEIGSYIQSFEQQNSGVAQILKNQVEDRGDEAKAAAVIYLAGTLRGIGESLTNMDSAPTQVASIHARLAKSYIDVGTSLALVPDATSDSDFIKAIEAYNVSADSFVKSYVAMAELFGAYGVVFTNTDAGSVFTFSAVSL